MNEIKRILIERDQMAPEEADELIAEVREMVAEDPDEAEDIIMSELGLELDYIFDLI